MGSSGARQTPRTITLNTVAPAANAIPVAVTEGPAGSTQTNRRTKVDLTLATRWRMVARGSTASSASSKFAIQWSLDQTSWFYLDGVASGSAPGVNAYVSLAAAASTLVTAEIPLPTDARSEVFLRCVTLDGDGSTTGAMAHASLQVR